MNHKQRLGYTVLGAVIMLIGIGIGSIVSPPLIAQRDGVFGEIECSKLTVVNETGEPRIILRQNEGAAVLQIHQPSGQFAISLSASEQGGSNLLLCDNAGEPSIQLLADELAHGVYIMDMEGAGKSISLDARKFGNNVYVFDKTRELAIGISAMEGFGNRVVAFGPKKRVVGLYAGKSHSHITARDDTGKITWTAP